MRARPITPFAPPRLHPTHRSFPSLCCALAILGLSGCTPIPPLDPNPTPDNNPTQTNPTPSGDPTDWTQSAEGKALIARADEVLGVIGQVRGLQADRPVQKGLMRRDDLKQVLLSKLAEEYTEEEIQNEALLLKTLGLIPADMDYKAFMVSLLVEQIAGFYDDDTKSLYILEGQATDTLDEVFSHELFHAIQDQRFGIGTLRDDAAKKNSDMMLARTALIEGDAVGVMLDYTLRSKGQSFSDIPGFPMIIKLSTSLMQGSGSAVFSSAPLSVKESLLFPYIAGSILVYEVKRKGGWDAVNKLYASPPASTEQVLHPERYMAADAPRAVHFELPDPASSGATRRVVYDNVMGELGWQVYFRQHQAEGTNPNQALSAAEGWDGDRILATQDGDSASVIVQNLSIWDTEADAVEFSQALLLAAKTRWPSATQRDLKSNLIQIMDVGDRFVLVERRADQVLYIEGAPDQGDSVQAAQSLAERSAHIWLTATIGTP